MTISPLNPQIPVTPPLLRSNSPIPEETPSPEELVAAVRVDNAQVIQKWIERKWNLDGQNQNGWTPLIMAAGCGNMSALKLLLDGKAGIDMPEKRGCPALTIASNEGCLEIVTELLERRACIEGAAPKTNSPLEAAVKNEHEDIAELLVKNGAVATNMAWQLAKTDAMAGILLADKYKPFNVKILYHSSDFTDQPIAVRNQGELLLLSSGGALLKTYSHLKQQPGEERPRGTYKIRKKILVDGQEDKLVRLVIHLDSRQGGPEAIRALVERTIQLYKRFETQIELIVESVNKNGRPRIYIYQKYYRQGDLLEYLINSSHLLSDSHRIAISRSLIAFLTDMHTKGFAHRDIKPENVLLDGDLNENGEIDLKTLQPMLTDFDFYGSDPETADDIAGSPRYCPPEFADIRALKSFQFNEMQMGDVWSLGMTLYALWTNGYPPGLDKIMSQPHIEPDLKYLSALSKLKDNDGAPFPKPSRPVFRMMWQMMQYNCKNRPKMTPEFLSLLDAEIKSLEK